MAAATLAAEKQTAGPVLHFHSGTHLGVSLVHSAGDRRGGPQPLHLDIHCQLPLHRAATHPLHQDHPSEKGR